ncbi:MAG: iron chelate uptake ABC transporter family permease subunit [Chloroflexota bacterium]|nr:iron chelate uptake ABC transporter family permease subunit [Chloroflexota bacterium]
MLYTSVSGLRGFRQMRVSARLTIGAAILLALVLVVALVSLSLGPVDIPTSHVAWIILSSIGFDVPEFARTEQLVIDQIRLPRIVVGASVGMALGVAGATMQGLFRNPMADPGIIGVSAGGALGAVIAIATGTAALFFLALPVFAFVGAMAAAFLVYGVAAVGGRFSMATLLLAGVAINAFLGAIVSAIIIVLPDNEALREILFWLAGGLDSRSWEHVRIATPLIVASTVLLLLMSRDLNLLMLGDDEARSMGVRVGATRITLLAAAALATGAAVAVSGTIAFVGLVIPHILRLVLGPDNRVLIPLSALAGAVFVILADTVARTIIEPAELRVGILTAFVGAPFFILLLIKNKRQVYSL